MAFIEMIKTWHVIAVLAFTLIFIVVTADRTTPTATRLKDALFYLLGVPIMLFAIAFLAFLAFYSRHYGAGQLFPSVLLAISAFVAVGLIGTVRKDPGFGAKIAILMGAVVSLLMSGLLVGLHSLSRRIGL